jgi:hypothetical protein
MLIQQIITVLAFTAEIASFFYPWHKKFPKKIPVELFGTWHITFRAIGETHTN